MQLVGERQVPDQSTQSLSQTIAGLNQTTTPPIPPNWIAWRNSSMAAFNALSLVLAVRLTLLVSVCGAIALAYLALSAADPYKLGALAIYAVVVVVPLVWLAARR